MSSLLKVLYYILEVFIVYLALAGTWEIAQATIARGLLSRVIQHRESEESYNPLMVLRPVKNVKSMLTWWFNWKQDERGVSDTVILKKRFGWGLRYLMCSIVFMYVLGKLKPLFL